MKPIRFEHSVLPYQIEISRRAWGVMQDYAQHWPWRKEAGGQLFGSINSFRLMIEEATRPRKKDRRSRGLLEIDTDAARLEISDRQRRGLIYFGDWHTHPEADAAPSLIDRQTAAKLMRGAPNNPFLVMVIVGWSTTFVGIHNSSSFMRMRRC